MFIVYLTCSVMSSVLGVCLDGMNMEEVRNNKELRIFSHSDGRKFLKPIVSFNKVMSSFPCSPYLSQRRHLSEHHRILYPREAAV